ncbi:hypothetical protein [Pseudomonas sp. RT6P73]
MSHEAATALLESSATNYERNAVIQEKEGRYEDAAHSRTNAAEYRKAIEALEVE